MAGQHRWIFKTRLRRGAYGWKGTRLASKRLKEAVSEMKKVAKSDPVSAGDGAVALMERLWPALEHIDSSSGALSMAVYRTLEALVPVLIEAPCNIKTRRKWLERLFEAVGEDGVSYLEPIEEQWGEICVFQELANEWVDRILPLLRETWGAEEGAGRVIGTKLCLSCLLFTERYRELEDLLLLESHSFWWNDQFWAEALARQGKIDEAIAYAESHRNDRYGDTSIDEFCERVLLEAGRANEAYQLYGLRMTMPGTYLSIFKKITKKYPERNPRQVLLDLIKKTGNKGQWFAAAKSAGYFDIALDCAHSSNTEPSTLIRAARDFADTEPRFSLGVALCTIDTLLLGGGYDPIPLDIINAFEYLMNAAIKLDCVDWAMAEVEKMVSHFSSDSECLMRKALVTRLRQQR